MVKTAIGAESGAPLRVLVCDDERHIVRLIQVNLERLGHTVTGAFDGEQAIQVLESVERWDIPHFDVVVLDVMMPKVDGFQVLKWIRSRERFDRIKVVMLVANARDKQAFEQYPVGADLYLTKPFNPTDIFR